MRDPRHALKGRTSVRRCRGLHEGTREPAQATRSAIRPTRALSIAPSSPRSGPRRRAFVSTSADCGQHAAPSGLTRRDEPRRDLQSAQQVQRGCSTCSERRDAKAHGRSQGGTPATGEARRSRRRRVRDPRRQGPRRRISMALRVDPLPRRPKVLRRRGATTGRGTRSQSSNGR